MAYMSLEEYHDLSGGEKRAPQGPKRQEIEYQEQVKLFKVLHNPVVLKLHPELRLIFGTLNGVPLTKGAAGKAKAAGNLKGVPDIICLIPAPGHRGLCIEMKSETGRQAAEQETFEREVTLKAYAYEVCRSAEEALKILESYLGYKLGD